MYSSCQYFIPLESNKALDSLLYYYKACSEYRHELIWGYFIYIEKELTPTNCFVWQLQGKKENKKENQIPVAASLPSSTYSWKQPGGTLTHKKVHSVFPWAKISSCPSLLKCQKIMIPALSPKAGLESKFKGSSASANPEGIWTQNNCDNIVQNGNYFYIIINNLFKYWSVSTGQYLTECALGDEQSSWYWSLLDIEQLRCKPFPGKLNHPTCVSNWSS